MSTDSNRGTAGLPLPDGERVHLLEEMTSGKKEGLVDKAKNMTDAAGIKTEGGRKFALCYETWTMLNVDGGG